MCKKILKVRVPKIYKTINKILWIITVIGDFGRAAHHSKISGDDRRDTMDEQRRAQILRQQL